MNKYLLPLGAFMVLVVLLAVGLSLNPRELPSPLVGKAAPDFNLPRLYEPEQTFSPQMMRGKVWLLNVWASWCLACREEHPLLLQLARSSDVPLIGLNYKDRREDALRWLKRYENPYQLIAVDADGRVGIDYGVYGVPETYVIDKMGIIRYKQIGPVTENSLKLQILPLVEELRR